MTPATSPNIYPRRPESDHRHSGPRPGQSSKILGPFWGRSCAIEPWLLAFSRLAWAFRCACSLTAPRWVASDSFLSLLTIRTLLRKAQSSPLARLRLFVILHCPGSQSHLSSKSATKSASLASIGAPRSQCINRGATAPLYTRLWSSYWPTRRVKQLGIINIPRQLDTIHKNASRLQPRPQNEVPIPKIG